MSGYDGEAVEELALDYFYDLFDNVFGKSLQLDKLRRSRRDQVEDTLRLAARAVCNASLRYFARQKAPIEDVEAVFARLRRLFDLLQLADVASPNISSGGLSERVLQTVPAGDDLEVRGLAEDYRLILNSVLQDLLRLGPAIANWQKLELKPNFAQLAKVIEELDAISDRIATFGGGADASADENFELAYRDYILQRFFQVEAGTVRMSTQAFVDLRNLFVMPRLEELPQTLADAEHEDIAILSLEDARKRYLGTAAPDGNAEEPQEAVEILSQHPRVAIVGPPGAGKSTLLEWLNIQIASAELPFVCAGEQAIPILLRLRQMNASAMPTPDEMVAAVTEGTDRVKRTPPGWLDRQMRGGRIVVMLDGLDETEPDLRDRHVIPWLTQRCDAYPDCVFWVSSRPVGYSPRMLAEREFSEYSVADFEPDQMALYCARWCTA